jgi:hypothetical protein
MKRLAQTVALLLAGAGCAADRRPDFERSSLAQRLPLYIATSSEGSGAEIFRVDTYPVEGVATAVPVASLANTCAGLARTREGRLLTLQESLGASLVMAADGDEVFPVTGVGDAVGLFADAWDGFVIGDARTGNVYRRGVGGTLRLQGSFGEAIVALTLGVHDELFALDASRTRVLALPPRATVAVRASLDFTAAAIAAGSDERVYAVPSDADLAGVGVYELGPDGGQTVVCQNLVNPTALAVDDSEGVLVAQGDPLDRVVRCSLGSGVKAIMVELAASPFLLTLSP